MKLKDIINIDELKTLIDNNYISENINPWDNSLKILNYTRKTQFEGLWNDTTKKSRGLIIKYDKNIEDATIQERPWEKFFTLEQHESGWALGDENESNKKIELNIDFDAKAEVTDKIDGSLGILYEVNDDIAITTKGSFNSEQSIYYTNFLKNNKKYYNQALKLKQSYPNITFLFELIGTNNRVVIDYKEDDIVLTGAVDVITGKYYSTDKFKDIWTLNRAEKFSAKNLNEALKIPYRENKEGLVVRIISENPKDQLSIKIKQDDYLKLHKLIGSFSKKDVKNKIREIDFIYKDFIDIFNEETIRKNQKINKHLQPYYNTEDEFYQYIYNKYINAMNENIMNISKNIYEYYNYIINLDKTYSIKEFVLSLDDNTDKSILIDMYKLRLDNKDILNSNANIVKKRILKNI